MLRGHPLVSAVVTTLLLLAGAGAASTYSAFSATTQNTGNTFTAAVATCSKIAGSQHTLEAVADTYVLGTEGGTDVSTTTRGSAEFVRMRAISQSGYSDAHVFVRFDFTGFESCTLSGATLKLTAFNDFTGTATHQATGYESTAGRTLQVWRAGGSWSESTLTWAGYTAMGAPQGTAVEMTTQQHPTESSGTAAPAVYQWPVVDHANAMITGTNNGFFLQDKDPTSSNGNEGANQFLRSKEYATTGDRPKLVVTVK